jgi:hypothetical protein
MILRRYVYKIPTVLVLEVRDTVEAWGVAVDRNYRIFIITPKATLFRIVGTALI